MVQEKAMEIVLATRNVHKIREFREILKSMKHIDFISLLNFSDYEQPEEDGETFQENAILKAEHAAKALNKWVLADDSGLVVPSIGGKPGVHSRRYSGEDATDVENCTKLLQEMESFEDLQRAAYYECSLALAGPDGIHKAVTGICEGHILKKGRGSRGFGYDPLFCKHDYDKTFGEVEERVKNHISHRYKAVEKILSTIETLKP